MFIWYYYKLLCQLPFVSHLKRFHTWHIVFNIVRFDNIYACICILYYLCILLFLEIWKPEPTQYIICFISYVKCTCTEMYQYQYLLQSVMTGHMYITVSTAVVDTVWTTLHGTIRLDIVTVDVTRDIKTITAAKVCNFTDK